MIEGIAGVTIWTEDIDRLLEFCRDVISLKVHRDHYDFVNFVFGDVRLNIGLHDRVKGQSRDPYRVMVSFAVTNILDEYDRLIGKGVEFIRPPEQEDWGGWIATLLDPDGNILQILQQPGPTVRRVHVKPS